MNGTREFVINYTYAKRIGNVFEIQWFLRESGTFSNTHICTFDLTLPKQVWFPVISSDGSEVVARGMIAQNGVCTIINSTGKQLANPFGRVVFLLKQ